MTRLIYAPSPFARLFNRTYPSHPFFWCAHLPKYHRVVSINRPSGYEPDALPLRHDDGVSLGGFDPPPLILKLSMCSHYTTMTRLICAPSRETSFTIPSHISVTDFTVSIFLKYITWNPMNIAFYIFINIYCAFAASILKNRIPIVSILQFSLCPLKRYIMCPPQRNKFLYSFAHNMPGSVTDFYPVIYTSLWR